MQKLNKYVDLKTGEVFNFLSDQLLDVIERNRDAIEARIEHSRDFKFDYFGFKTLEKSYLLKIEGDVVVERPQYMFMRVALGIHMDDLDAAFETYDLLSNKWFVHASPTLYHAGTWRPQMSSCFLLGMADDSIEGNNQSNLILLLSQC